MGTSLISHLVPKYTARTSPMNLSATLVKESAHKAALLNKITSGGRKLSKRSKITSRRTKKAKKAKKAKNTRKVSRLRRSKKSRKYKPRSHKVYKGGFSFGTFFNKMGGDIQSGAKSVMSKDTALMHKVDAKSDSLAKGAETKLKGLSSSTTKGSGVATGAPGTKVLAPNMPGKQMPGSTNTSTDVVAKQVQSSAATKHVANVKGFSQWGLF